MQSSFIVIENSFLNYRLLSVVYVEEPKNLMNVAIPVVMEACAKKNAMGRFAVRIPEDWMNAESAVFWTTMVL